MKPIKIVGGVSSDVRDKVLDSAFGGIRAQVENRVVNKVSHIVLDDFFELVFNLYSQMQAEINLIVENEKN